MVKTWFIRVCTAVLFALWIGFGPVLSPVFGPVFSPVFGASAGTGSGTGSGADPARPVTVFAAASLGNALQEVLAHWPGEVRLSLGGSGAMARQVDQGAPADVVMLASPEWMDWLEGRGRLMAGSRSAPLGNALVIAGPPGAEPLAAADLPALLQRLGDDGRLAMGEHRSVPAGQYAKAWLEARGHWEALRPRLAEVENVRAALALVSRGEVPLAILYASDLVAAPDSAPDSAPDGDPDGAPHAAPRNASAVWTIPPHEQPEIRYALAAVTEQGRALADFLSGPEAGEIYRAHGFTTEAP